MSFVINSHPITGYCQIFGSLHFTNKIKLIRIFLNYTPFYKQYLFSFQLQCHLTFLWIELQMLLRCCLIHISIIIVRHFTFINFYQCLGLGLFISHLRDLFFIFILSFIMINCIISWIQTHLFFSLFFRIFATILDETVDEERD